MAPLGLHPLLSLGEGEKKAAKEEANDAVICTRRRRRGPWRDQGRGRGIEVSGQHTKNGRRRRGWRKEEKSGAEWLKNVNSLPPSSTTRGL